MNFVQYKTFEELAEMETGEIVASFQSGLLRGMIVRGPASLCAYIGFPRWHPLAGFDYDSIPLDVHGGLTFAGTSSDLGVKSSNLYWFGWDYAHFMDFMFYYIDPEMAHIFKDGHNDERKWDVEKVHAELKKAMRDFLPIFYYGWVLIILKQVIRSWRLKWQSLVKLISAYIARTRHL